MAYKGHLSDKEFFEQMCRWADSLSTQTASKWWNAAFEVIVRNVYLQGSCRIPGLGVITTKEVKETYQKQINPETGETVVYKVPARVLPYLIASDDFVNDVNAEGVTKQYRKRLKANALTMRDYEREVRAQALNGQPTDKKVEEAKEEFKKLLKQKVAKNKAKLERNENEEE
mgnify:CR=1 FL=1